jgi:uncharacterized protein DUF4236
MGFNFSKRIKIAPGVTLNLSKSGVSTSIGPRGAKLTLGSRRGTRATVGLPGTGLSYTSILKRGGAGAKGFWIVVLLALVGLLAWKVLWPAIGAKGF